MHRSSTVSTSAKPAKSPRRASAPGRHAGPSPAPFHKKHETAIHILTLSFFACILYAGAINHDYVYDDIIMSYGNKYVQEGIKGIPAMFGNAYLRGFSSNESDMTSYRPLSLALTAVEKQFFGNNPKVHHAANVLYYMLGIIALYGFLRLLFKKSGALMPFVVSLLFAAHPIHSGVVAYIKNREVLLCFLFIITSQIFVLRYAKSKRAADLLLGLAAFLLCTLAKDDGIAFVLLVPLTLYFARESSRRRNALAVGSFAGVALLYLLIRMTVLGGLNASANAVVTVDNNALMAAGGIQRLATAVAYMGKYAFMLLWPHPLSCDYAYNQLPIVNWTDPRALLSLALFAGLLAYAIVRFKSRSVVSYAIVLSFISISMVSNLFITLGTTFAERFEFTVALGFCLVAGALLTGTRGFDAPARPAPRLTTPALAALVAILALYSAEIYARVPEWKDNLTLFSADARHCPNSFRLQGNLGQELFDHGRADPSPESKRLYLTEAQQHLARSLEILPYQPMVWVTLGVCKFQLGNMQEAMQDYKKGLSMNPDIKDALNDLGYCYFQMGRPDSTLSYCDRALALDPAYALAVANSGLAYQKLGRYAKAVECYEKAIALDPGLDRAYKVNCANVCQFIGETAKAEKYRRMAD